MFAMLHIFSSKHKGWYFGQKCSPYVPSFYFLTLSHQAWPISGITTDHLLLRITLRASHWGQLPLCTNLLDSMVNWCHFYWVALLDLSNMFCKKTAKISFSNFSEQHQILWFVLTVKMGRFNILLNHNFPQRCLKAVFHILLPIFWHYI